MADKQKPKETAVVQSKTATELYRVLRPTQWKDVFGQPDAVAQLMDFEKKGRFPHAILFSGPSGVGKTTLTRIIQHKLECSGFGNYKEINAANDTGVDSIRAIEDVYRLAPTPPGKNRLWAIDECHALTTNAQNCLLKMLEDPPNHVYFIMATTVFDKILATIKTRCTKIILKSLSATDMMKVMVSVQQQDAQAAKVSITVIERIISVADGSPREALVILNQVMGLPTEAAQLEAVQKTSLKEDAFKIVKALIWERSKWSDVAKLLSAIEDDAEGIRLLVLTCARTELLRANANAPKAYRIITAFEGSIFHSGKPGHASLARACYEVLTSK